MSMQSLDRASFRGRSNRRAFGVSGVALLFVVAAVPCQTSPSGGGRPDLEIVQKQVSVNESSTDARSAFGDLDADLPWHVRDRVTGVELLLVPFGRGVDEVWYLSKFETTNRQMKLWDPSFFSCWLPGQEFNGPDQPAVGVAPSDAAAFCETFGFVLPSAELWKAAAGWDRVEDMGADWRARANFQHPDGAPLASFRSVETDSFASTNPVGALGAPGPFGFHDMFGNAAELVRDGERFKMCGGHWDSRTAVGCELHPLADPFRRTLGFRVALPAAVVAELLENEAPPESTEETLELGAWAVAVANAVPTDPSETLQRLLDTGLPWRVRHRASGIEMVLIPPGRVVFGRGDYEGEIRGGDDDTAAPIEVVVDVPFYLAATELSVGELRRLVPDAASSGDSAELPATGVDPELVRRICREHTLRLPTGSEQRFAASAGRPSPYPWGGRAAEWAGSENLLDRSAEMAPVPLDEPFEHVDGWSELAPVIHGQPNRFGLFGANGNVAEWCRWDTTGKLALLGSSWASGVRASRSPWPRSAVRGRREAGIRLAHGVAGDR